MREIANLEIHVSHACNLACESCSHYSNQGHKGNLAPDEAARWMSAWNRRLQPRILSLLGGEPTVNPDLAALVTMTRAYWPETHLRLVTNGFLLARHPELPRALRDAGNAVLYLSIHHESAEYLDKLQPAIGLLQAWQRDFGVQLTVYRSAKSWTRRYHGEGSAMQPFRDGNPRLSWERCSARFCPQLFEGKIWKCAPLAYLGMQDRKYKLDERWAPSLKYEPLTSGCSDSELDAFFDREEEAVCGMCPADPQRFAIPMPLRNVTPAPVSGKTAGV